VVNLRCRGLRCLYRGPIKVDEAGPAGHDFPKALQPVRRRQAGEATLLLGSEGAKPSTGWYGCNETPNIHRPGVKGIQAQLDQVSARCQGLPGALNHCFRIAAAYRRNQEGHDPAPA
jgi:hypothetical protein